MSEEIDWSVTTFEGARRAQRRESSKLSFRERVMWVEEMYELAERLQRCVKPDTATDDAQQDSKGSGG